MSWNCEDCGELFASNKPHIRLQDDSMFCLNCWAYTQAYNRLSNIYRRNVLIEAEDVALVMKKNNWNQATMARNLRISESYISKIMFIIEHARVKDKQRIIREHMTVDKAYRYLKSRKV